jgi:hypothetical protein
MNNFTKHALPSAKILGLALSLFVVSSSAECPVGTTDLMPWPDVGCTDSARICDISSCFSSLSLFKAAFSSRVGGRGLPYWRDPRQPELGVVNPNITTAIIAHHGLIRNGEDFHCWMQGAVARHFGGRGTAEFDSSLIIAPQVQVSKDGGKTSYKGDGIAHASTLWVREGGGYPLPRRTNCWYTKVQNRD